MNGFEIIDPAKYETNFLAAKLRRKGVDLVIWVGLCYYGNEASADQDRLCSLMLLSLGLKPVGIY